MYYARGGDSLNFSAGGPGNAVLIKSGHPWLDRISDHAALERMQSLNPDSQGRPREIGRLCAGQTLLCKAMGLKVPEWDAQRFDPQRLFVDDVGERPSQVIQAARLGIPEGARRTPAVPFRRCRLRRLLYPQPTAPRPGRRARLSSTRTPGPAPAMSLDSFNAWMAANPEWLGLAIFLIAFLECAAIVGIVLPGVVLLFGVAVIAGSGALSLGETLMLAYAGGVLGDLSSYWIGRRFHQNIRRLPGLRSHPQWITAAEVYFERYGIASLLVGRFIGALRPMLPMVAGMLDMPFGRFLGVSLIAAAGWAVAYLLPGWATGAALRLPLPEGF